MKKLRNLLLKWNKENHHTFEDRARFARVVMLSDLPELEFMAHAVFNGGK